MVQEGMIRNIYAVHLYRDTLRFIAKAPAESQAELSAEFRGKFRAASSADGPVIDSLISMGYHQFMKEEEIIDNPKDN